MPFIRLASADSKAMFVIAPPRLDTLNQNIDVYSARCEQIQRVWARCADLEVGLTVYHRPLKNRKSFRVLDNRTHPKRPESAFFGGSDAETVIDELEKHSLTKMQAITVLTAIGASLGLGNTGTRVASTGLKVLAEGLKANTIQIIVTTTAAGAFVTLTGIGMIALGISLAIITLNIILPKVKTPPSPQKEPRR